MGRPKANPTTQVNQQPQYHFQSVSQSPETIDDVPPPFETFNDEIQQERSGNEPSKVSKENGPNNQRQTPTASNQTRATTPRAFPPQSSQANASQLAAQFPPGNHQTRSPTGTGGGQPPQASPQAFPPQPQAFPRSQDEAQAFPPSQDEAQSFPPHPSPQAFPPPQGEPQAFPPPQGTPQAFPPQADHHHHQPQGFPPAQDEPQAFRPSQGQPQAFPPQPATFQQHGMQFQPTPQMIMPSSTPGFPVTNQNPVIQFPTESWKTGLFGCLDDPTNALVTACFPCLTFGQIAEIIDSGQTSCATSGLLYGVIWFFIGMPCLMSCTYRAKLRARFGLIESPAPDWVIHCCCECCALCQEYRELNQRGLDPSIGWLGNVAKQQQMVQLGTMTPPMKQTMMG